MKTNNDKRNISALKRLLFLIIIPILSIGYQFLNNAERKVYDLHTNLDNIITFNKYFIYPYIYWYIYIILFFIYMSFKDKDRFYNAITEITIGIIICFVIYYFFQSTVARPDISYDSSITGKIVKCVYNMDKPFNCFPSIHILETIIVFKHLNNVENKGIKIYNYMSMILITLSVLFIKQHVIVDVIAGLVLAITLYKIRPYNKINNFLTKNNKAPYR